MTGCEPTVLDHVDGCERLYNGSLARENDIQKENNRGKSNKSHSLLLNAIHQLSIISKLKREKFHVKFIGFSHRNPKLNSNDVLPFSHYIHSIETITSVFKWMQLEKERVQKIVFFISNGTKRRNCKLIVLNTGLGCERKVEKKGVK